MINVIVRRSSHSLRDHKHTLYHSKLYDEDNNRVLIITNTRATVLRRKSGLIDRHGFFVPCRICETG